MIISTYGGLLATNELVLDPLLLVQERERREHELKQQQKTGRKPGFDGRWYTDPNAHLARE